jgi:DNA-binding IclR family transcriptional regulator
VTAEPDDDPARVGSRSVVRALTVLELLAGGNRPLGLAEIARTIGIPKTSALLLLRALIAREFVATDDVGRYVLGVRSFEVGSAYLRGMTPVRSVEPELVELTGALQVTAHFAVLDGEEVVYLAKHDPPSIAFGLASALGARLRAAHTAVGKAQVAHLWPDDRIAAHGPDFTQEMQRVRELGYATDDGATAPGIRCVAVPVFDSRRCIGAIGVSQLLNGGPELDRVVTAVAAAADRASARLGGRARTDGSVADG